MPRDAACAARRSMRRHERCAAAAPRLALALACLALCARGTHARSAAARASASGAGGGANSGIVQLVSTAASAPLLPALQANANAAFAAAAAALAGSSMVCGDISILQGSSYTRRADLGDGFAHLSPSASDTIAALLAVRALRLPCVRRCAAACVRACWAAACARACARAAWRAARRFRSGGGVVKGSHVGRSFFFSVLTAERTPLPRAGARRHRGGGARRGAERRERLPH
jgi:hypothetical protein